MFWNRWDWLPLRSGQRLFRLLDRVGGLWAPISMLAGWEGQESLLTGAPTPL